METLDDIRREEGNPRAGKVAGEPRSVFGFFPSSTAARLVSFLCALLGLTLLLIGGMFYLVSLIIVGLIITLLSIMSYAWAKYHSYPTS